MCLLTERPGEANEIATTDLALKALGVEPEIGAEVPLEFELLRENLSL